MFLKKTILLSGFSIGSFMAGYTFNQVGSSTSFRYLSYTALAAFFIQVSVNKLVQIKTTIAKKTKEPSINGNNSVSVAKEHNV